MIHITSSIHGVEVAGVRHPNITVHYQDDTFTSAQLEAFEAAGFLTVQFDSDEPVAETVSDQAGSDEPDAEAGSDQAGSDEPVAEADSDQAGSDEPVAEADSDQAGSDEPVAEAGSDQAGSDEPVQRLKAQAKKKAKN